MGVEGAEIGTIQVPEPAFWPVPRPVEAPVEPVKEPVPA